jgi:hypothetical protein
MKKNNGFPNHDACIEEGRRLDEILEIGNVVPFTNKIQKTERPINRNY